MGTLIKPFTYSNGTVIDATELNSNLDTLYTGVNGNIDSANIATGGVNTSELADDAVDETKIDWGTGASQVSLDDVPNGTTSKLGQDCSTTGNPTFAAPTVTTLNIDTTGKLTSGGIDYAGANVPGWVCNLGISLSSGVLSMVDAQGSALSTTNPAWVTMPSTTSGQLVQIKITSASFSFNDDVHASSDLANLGFGITETVDWAQDVPFFIYLINRNNTNADGVDGNSVVAISRNPALYTSPSSSNDIGDTGAIPSNDNQNVVLILSDVTIGNYTSLPMQRIGAFRMRWSTSTDDWTVQTLSSYDGIGSVALDRAFSRIYNMPQGQNGASYAYFSESAGGNTPTWATVANIVAYYQIGPNGLVHYFGSTRNAGNCTNATTGTLAMRLHLPTHIGKAITSATSYKTIGTYKASSESPTGEILHASVTEGLAYCDLSLTAWEDTLNANSFSNSADDLDWDFTYNGFVQP